VGVLSAEAVRPWVDLKMNRFTVYLTDTHTAYSYAMTFTNVYKSPPG
jgi:hypothetical protein